MEVTDATFEHLAKLARLQFDDKERESIKEDLKKMIAFVEKLNELDTTGVEPLLHITNNENAMREDEVMNMCSREDALRNAALADDNFFKVPKVIRK
jgi:aspartyl-tRNA(Asn)/glutamyl-tRNA(Gln) amidotransferase subunit C